ncbi:MAG: hypothetical protein AMXMBFR53_25320 [Gemmatimonadota bacterium]
MYAHCLFCQGALKDNAVVEAFPRGRRLAFDTERGRLWVLCPSCARWNLVPLEERWEAVEECERLYRGLPRRFSTENIGLARHPSGLDLIRVGRPEEHEYAFWRYGRVFRRRWMRNTLLAGGVGVVLTAGVVGQWVAGVAAFGGLVTAANLVSLANVMGLKRGMVRVRVNRYTVTRLTVGQASTTRLPWVPLGDPLLLEIPHVWGAIRREGDEAWSLLARILPALNRDGAREPEVNEAVKQVAGRGGPEGFLEFVHNDRDWREKATWTPPFNKKATQADLPARMPLPLRLGLEMSLNENREAEALRGELAALEAAWREAEELAGISDDLLLPSGWSAFRARHRGAGDPAPGPDDAGDGVGDPGQRP